MYFSKRNKLISCVPRKRLATRGGEILKGVLKRNFVYDYLLSKIKYLEGARGLITLQLLEKLRKKYHLF